MMNYVYAKNGKLLIEVIQSECDLCGCCVGICPEDAIELTAEKLNIIPLRCTNCAKCVWSCPLEALVLNKNGVLV